jgi:hypothetical protein
MGAGTDGGAGGPHPAFRDLSLVCRLMTNLSLSAKARASQCSATNAARCKRGKMNWRWPKELDDQRRIRSGWRCPTPFSEGFCSRWSITIICCGRFWAVSFKPACFSSASKRVAPPIGSAAMAAPPEAEAETPPLASAVRNAALSGLYVKEKSQRPSRSVPFSTGQVSSDALP